VHQTIGLAWVSAVILEELTVEAERNAPLETGGVLLGYWAKEFEEVVVTRATGPGPAAVHGRWHFVPDSRFQREEIARIYRESGHTETYLGDWHSHPNGTVALSWQDRLTLAKIAQERAARAPAPLMGIVAGGPSWTPMVWRYQSRRFSFLRGPNAVPLGLRPYPP
jgi:integrative and conjugative element protein (TIGR02256 family)